MKKESTLQQKIYPILKWVSKNDEIKYPQRGSDLLHGLKRELRQLHLMRSLLFSLIQVRLISSEMINWHLPACHNF